MAVLLHIDSSLSPLERSGSRRLTDAFRRAWEEEHPQGSVVYRDLAATPVPHLDAATVTAASVPPLREELIAEFEKADVVLIGAPMYNFTIPSTLKAWLDHVILAGRTFGPGVAPSGKRAVVASSRGGSYRPGTPRAGFEFDTNYLEKVLGDGLGLQVEVITRELTMAAVNPAMAELVPQAEESARQSLERAAESAREHAALLA
ncbi:MULTISPECIES: FMN-dependent NADH-azoreductase [unclassified Streptomyces]|uniref:FMN-dependent NADH-azoreductase n=1 Tax=unclassified Streptomyces TaxID=2593676 RepID=UPI000748F259|nr:MULTISPECIES: NAD(P)H-dependent oxidoreductase [unclassified Streptomyces]KUL51767.1 FMN-dependent NADH-azoreductase [Streptomyces sp. NRRL S-1521]THC50829.1 FMN-dependent NADH-azoreductase [Streptomyces sp. A1499]